MLVNSLWCTKKWKWNIHTLYMLACSLSSDSIRIACGRSLLTYIVLGENKHRTDVGIPALEWMKWYNLHVFVCAYWHFQSHIIINNYIDKIPTVCIGWLFSFLSIHFIVCIWRMAKFEKERRNETKNEHTANKERKEKRELWKKIRMVFVVYAVNQLCAVLIK